MDNKGTAFVIMQIGNKDLDQLYLEAIVPSIQAAQLTAKRIDIDNEGDLLKKEILENIEKADIIIADLTNERPNCYLEIGYAIGIDKIKSLIFTVHEDHFSGSPNYQPNGPKIHFDVSGYSILGWDPYNVNEFKSKLTEIIERRLTITKPSQIKTQKLLWDQQWLDLQRSIVAQRFEMLKINRKAEFLISPIESYLNILQSNLKDIAYESQIDTFGWPIGIILKNDPDNPVIVKSDGIISEVWRKLINNSYDFSYYRKNGQLFITKSLFEELNYKKSIIPEARVKRMTELLLFISRYFIKCGLFQSSKIKIEIRFSGILDNDIVFPYGLQRKSYNSSHENECFYELSVTINEIENRLPELVNEILENLFVLFDFYKMDFGYLSEIVNKFIKDTNARR